MKSSFDGKEKENVDLSGPFDPNSIDVDISTVNLGFLLEQLEYGDIDLNPEFQRSSDVWDPKKKSRLIESVLLGLPLPSFYFCEDPNTNKLLIVDGLQRLCAFKDFWIKKSLVLQELQFLKNLEGKKADDFDRNQVRSMKSLKITINTLRKKTPAIVKYVIFNRVNTAGVPLNPQEIRNALYQKQATDLLNRLVNLPSFLKATNNKIKTKRMEDCSLVNRFVAFYLNVEYKGNLDTFMCESLDKVNKMQPNEVESIYESFNTSMETCFMLFGKNSFKRPNLDKEGKFLKLNKAIFETLSVSIARLSDIERKKLIEKKEDFVNNMHLLFKDDKFIKSVTEGTSKIEKVQFRFSQVTNLINQVLNHDK